jgi:hypothetical protein
MGRGVGGLEEGLMALLECRRRAGPRALVVVEPPLHGDVRVPPVQVACARRAHKGFMAARPPGPDGLKRVGGIGAATVRDHVRRNPILSAGGIEPHQGHPRRFRGGPRPRPHRTRRVHGRTVSGGVCVSGARGVAGRSASSTSGRITSSRHGI